MISSLVSEVEAVSLNAATANEEANVEISEKLKSASEAFDRHGDSMKNMPILHIGSSAYTSPSPPRRKQQRQLLPPTPNSGGSTRFEASRSPTPAEKLVHLEEQNDVLSREVSKLKDKNNALKQYIQNCESEIRRLQNVVQEFEKAYEHFEEDDID